MSEYDFAIKDAERFVDMLQQRLTDLERNLNEERQTKQRLETQIKTEKSLTKKLQDDVTKLTLTPAKFVEINI